MFWRDAATRQAAMARRQPLLYDKLDNLTDQDPLMSLERAQSADDLSNSFGFQPVDADRKVY